VELFDGEGESREWLSILADIMMLTIVFFVYYFTFVEMEQQHTSSDARESAPQARMQESSGDGILPGYNSLLPTVLSALPQEIDHGITVTTLDANRLLIRLEGSVHFETGSTEISPAMRSVLDGLVPLLVRDEALRVSIHGHTDNAPIHRQRFRDNWELSVLRSTETLRYLMDRGVDPNRLSASGHGESRPVASNETETGRAQNRRIEVVLERDSGSHLAWRTAAAG
jgi:chemotaxis protein MotB